MQNMINTLKTNSKKGFTLIEMIIVIVIIAILAAIAIPAMQGYIQDAKDATAIANCRTALTASEASVATAKTVAEYEASLVASLGGDAAITVTDGDPVVVEGTWADGTLYIEATLGLGTQKITWADAEGTTAVWNEGDSAPVIETSAP